MIGRFLRYRPRPRILNWLRPRGPRDRQHAPYSVISSRPVVLYVPYWIDDRMIPMSSLEIVYEYLKDRRASFLLNWFWQMEEPAKIRAYARLERAHVRKYPGHRFVHLCNTTRQFQRFVDEGLEAIFCNQNCLVDESVFRPLPGAEKILDAVYDGRFLPHKRHFLASGVRSLGLVYAYDEGVDSPGGVSQVRSMLPDARLFNHAADGEYRPLPAAEVNECLNRCRTGLCLSNVEGAMYASVQYLLAGLPVVSTHSEGGRDVMFDERFVSIAAATPAAVREAVGRWCRESPPADFIRAATLEKILVHRQRLIDLVQRIYDEEGSAKRFASEWPDLFFNKLYHPRQSHVETIACLEEAAGGS